MCVLSAPGTSSFLSTVKLPISVITQSLGSSHCQFLHIFWEHSPPGDILWFLLLLSARAFRPDVGCKSDVIEQDMTVSLGETAIVTFPNRKGYDGRPSHVELLWGM